MSHPSSAASVIDRDRLQDLMNRELGAFANARPKSAEAWTQTKRNWLGGVPMPWMMRWAGAFPPVVERAVGSRIVDIDGHEYVDLCLGDTGAMSGHAPPALVAAVSEQVAAGITTMMPSPHAAWVGEELTRRFGVERWMLTLTATDANRAALRICRGVTGGEKVLIVSYSYHGSVDETFAIRDAVTGATVEREGNIGPSVGVGETTVAIEFNDVAMLEEALQTHSIACVLMEPAMTNMGIVLPDPGYHDELRRLTRLYEVPLIIDETHTMSAGPAGCTGAWGLEPDLVVVGKAIGGGIPSGALGISAELAQRALSRADHDFEDTGGVGGTLAGNALTLASMRVALDQLLTPEAYAHTIPLAARFAAGFEQVVDEAELPWSVAQLGCRAEYCFLPEMPRNGTQAHDGSDHELERYLHLHALNRGVILTPFHNMALMAPTTTEADVDRHTEVFREAVADLFG
jgi:glutamate-1-semialdehyde 2,1-aminomutase